MPSRAVTQDVHIEQMSKDPGPENEATRTAEHVRHAGDTQSKSYCADKSCAEMARVKLLAWLAGGP